MMFSSSIMVLIILPINRHLLIGPDAYPLESIKLHMAWAAGFSHLILVTENRLSKNRIQKNPCVRL